MSTDKARADAEYARAIKLSDPKAQIDAYTLAMGLDRKPPTWAFQNRGWAYFKTAEFAAALADWKKGGRDYALPRGRAHLALGEHAHAIKELEKALADDEDDEDIKGYLAEARAAAGGTAPSPAEATKPPKATKPAKHAKPAKPQALPVRKRGEAHDDYAERLLATLDAKLARAIDRLRLPAVIATTTPRAKGRSRIGGLPDLPAGVAWPRHAKEPMSFVAQIALEELPAGTPLPKKGLLCFFVCEGDDYLERGVVLLTDAKRARPAELPADFARPAHGKSVRAPYRARGLAFTAVRRLPAPSHPCMKLLKLSADDETAYHRVFEALVEFDQHQLLGFRDRSWDGEQSAGTRLLFQLFSDGATEMEWGDADHLYFYIPEKALAARNFSKAFTYSGD